VKAEHAGGVVRLTGEVSDRTHHDRLIDLFVAMEVYAIANGIRIPKGPR
jgi:hypothetical protein